MAAPCFGFLGVIASFGVSNPSFSVTGNDSISFSAICVGTVAQLRLRRNGGPAQTADAVSMRRRRFSRRRYTWVVSPRTWPISSRRGNEARSRLDPAVRATGAHDHPAARSQSAGRVAARVDAYARRVILAVWVSPEWVQELARLVKVAGAVELADRSARVLRHGGSSALGGD